MIDHTQPLAATNPEAARHLALSTFYLRRQDFGRAIHYARMPLLAGEPSAAINLLTTQALTRKYEAAAETARMCLTGAVHHSVRRGVLEAVLGGMALTLAPTRGRASGLVVERWRAAPSTRGRV